MNQHKSKRNLQTKIQDLRSAEFLERIKKSLYYPARPVNNYLSLPVLELTSEVFSEISNHQLEKLDVEVASRISDTICASPCALVLTLLYIERLKNCNPKYLRNVASSELFLVSLMVASKFLHDDGSEDEVVDALWAVSGRITLSKLIKLEMDFLKAINWMVSVQEEVFWERLQQLEKEVAYQEVQKRSWCSYTELYYLMNSNQLITIANSVILVCCVCMTTYVVCFFIMLGSTLILETITLSHIWFIQMPLWQSVNETSSITSYGTILSDMQFCALNNEHTTPISPLFGIDYKDEDHITVKIQNEVDYVIGDSNDNTSWQWWLNSTMTWLAEYSDLKNFTRQITKFDDGKSTYNNTQILSDITQDTRIRNIEDFTIHLRRALYSFLNRISKHWKELNDLHHQIVAQSLKRIDYLVQSQRFDR